MGGRSEDAQRQASEGHRRARGTARLVAERRAPNRAFLFARRKGQDGESGVSANSNVSKGGSSDKKLKRITSGEVRTRKRSVRKQFQEAFVVGDMRTATEYMLFEVALPSMRDAVVDSLIGGIERLFTGDGRRRSAGPSPSGSAPYVNYGKCSDEGRGLLASPKRGMSSQGRARHNFSEIVLSTRAEAEEVIDQMFEVIERWGEVSVADLYELLGVAADHTDQKWGWRSLGESLCPPSS
jgi:hypothetical protein